MESEGGYRKTYKIYREKERWRAREAIERHTEYREKDRWRAREAIERHTEYREKDR